MELEAAPPAVEAPPAVSPEEVAREAALAAWRARALQHRELDAKVRALRGEVAAARAEHDKTEEDLRALQSVGQIIGEVLRQLDPERCERRPSPPPRLRPLHLHSILWPSL
jgi:26S proteasome regulatory subunit T4